MRRLTRLVSITIALTAAATTSLATAARPTDPAADLALFYRLGGTRSSAWGGSYLALLGLDALVRWQVLAAGVGGEWKTVLLRNAVDAHGTLGLSLPISPLRIDAFGIYGWRYYSHWGASLMRDDPGASATLPFAGARLRLTYEAISRREVTALVGLTFGYDDDLSRRHVDYTYIETPWAILGSEESRTMSGHQEIGANYWSLAFTAGGAFRLL